MEFVLTVNRIQLASTVKPAETATTDPPRYRDFIILKIILMTI